MITKGVLLVQFRGSKGQKEKSTTNVIGSYLVGYFDSYFLNLTEKEETK